MTARCLRFLFLPAVVSLLLVAAAVAAKPAGAAPGLCETRFVIVAPHEGVDAAIQRMLQEAQQQGFVLDADAGAVIFGDGIRGRVPDTGDRLDPQYRPGGGQSDQGNAPESSPALRHRDRAVSPADFERLVLATPGGKVGRVSIAGCP